jgi:hypothetical protein
MDKLIESIAEYARDDDVSAAVRAVCTAFAVGGL